MGTLGRLRALTCAATRTDDWLRRTSATFDWDDVRFFLAVVRENKISFAARTLGCDDSTVARRILALEDALGTKLFDRSNSGYTLTKRGQTFLPVAEAMERDALIAQSEMLGWDDLLKR